MNNYSMLKIQIGILFPTFKDKIKNNFGLFNWAVTDPENSGGGYEHHQSLKNTKDKK